jgi:hypothetical protein
MNELSELQAVVLQMAELQKQFLSRETGGNTGGLLQKHTLAADANGMAKPLNELGFFTDAMLERPVINATLSPINSLVNVVPVVPANTAKTRFSFITAFGGDETGTQPDYPCDDPETINDDVAACKIEFEFARKALRSKTGEIDELIQVASRGLYDDFYFLGNVRGASATPLQQLTVNDRDLIIAGAVRKQLSFMGRTWQKWLMKKMWEGDPANNSAHDGYKEFYGLNSLVIGDYAGSSLPLTGSTSVANCAALNSDVKVFTDYGSGVVGGDGSIFRVMQELEHTLFSRAQQMGLVVDWRWVMPSVHWNEIVKVLPCEMAGDGCSGAVINANDGGNGLFNVAMREQMNRSMSVTLNGRTYPVILDDAITYTYDGANTAYTADIFFLPFVVNGEPVLYLEHKDYSLVTQTLRPVSAANTNLMEGFSDGGRYLFKVQENSFCFEMQGKTEPRLIFRAPHLAGRIQNVEVRPMQQKPVFFAAA